ncbi:MAG TPA: hypothetical protein VKZ56_04060 [Membranihabitans sp.]|nr:hypothetical protein [Membranihabitans sp.]
MKTSLFSLFNLVFLLITFGCGNNSESSTDTGQDEMDTMVTEPSVTLLWKTDTLFSDSESTLYHAATNTIYVTCGNNSIEKDGDGYIATLNPDGSVKQLDWVTGLHAPKGMATIGNSLYVSDIDEIVEIDLKSGKIINKYPLEGAQFLNDVATDGSVIYFSDMRDNKVYTLSDGEFELVAENVPSINGLESYNGTLYGLNKEGLIKFDGDGGYEILTDEVQGGDGLIILDDDTFIASRWAGQIYFVDGNKVTLLLDTSPEQSNTADIGYIPDQQIIIVPTFKKNEVAAYQLTLGD